MSLGLSESVSPSSRRTLTKSHCNLWRIALCMVVVAHQQHQPAHGSRSRHRQGGFFRHSEFAFRGGETSASSKATADTVFGTELSPSSAHTTFVKPSLVFGGGVTNSSYKFSVRSIKGHRSYMEDEFVVSPGGHFAAVFDGHGGASVSKYLRQNLYANLQAALPSVREENSTVDAAEALRSAFEKVDREVQRISHWSFQGSTAVAILLHPSGNETFILAANVGDSRAVLSRGGMAVDLTRDHKPNDPGERARIEALGGRVEWCGSGTNGNGIHRINGNLALSRAIGDRSERPLVSSKSDITTTPILPAQDEFIVIASDGLWDVMSSQDAISFVQDTLGTPLPAISEDPQDMEREARQIRSERKRIMSKRLTKEALRRGSSDNITVLIVWLKDSMTEEFVLQSR